MERVPVTDQRLERTVLPAGTVVRGYELHHLGFGGMSVVYRGLKKGQTYLVKEVAADNPVQVLALTQEKGLLERLDHPGIVHFFSLFEESGFYYMVAEFIEGPTLEAYVESHPPDETRVRDWMVQLCEIFRYLHCQKPPIIYRDLKPANLILQGDRLRLVDFGIARVYKGDREEDTEMLGSFFTASPEHYGAAETDVRSDVFTLGATAYDILSQGARRNQMPSTHPPVRTLNPAVSPELEEIVKRCLAFKPEDRFQSVDELQRALAPASLARPETRRRVSPLLVALMLFTLVGLGVAVRSSGSRHTHEAGPTEDTGIEGDVFGFLERSQNYVVTLGEDIGLFRVTPLAGEKPEERAQALARRLNQLYHEQCPTCGVFRLEPAGLRIGRYTDPQTGLQPVAVFYSHEEPKNEAGEHVYRSPTILTLVDEKQARAVGSTPKFVAGYWRDLTRDLVEISRGREASDTPLGRELNAELLAARRGMGEHPSLANLRLVLSQLTSDKATRLQEMFEHVPGDFRCQSDQFPALENLTPLKG